MRHLLSHTRSRSPGWPEISGSKSAPQPRRFHSRRGRGGRRGRRRPGGSLRRSAGNRRRSAILRAEVRPGGRGGCAGVGDAGRRDSTRAWAWPMAWRAFLAWSWRARAGETALGRRLGPGDEAEGGQWPDVLAGRIPFARDRGRCNRRAGPWGRRRSRRAAPRRVEFRRTQAARKPGGAGRGGGGNPCRRCGSSGGECRDGRGAGRRRRGAQLCYSGHGSLSSNKLADPAAGVLPALARPLLFRPGRSGPGSAIVP